MLKYAIFALWAAIAGALIPVMAMLNVRLGRALGEPAQAPVVLFVVSLSVAMAVSLLVSGGLPNLRLLGRASAVDLAGGAITATYVITVTLLAPRFGISRVILFAVTAQIITSAVIDQFGLFGSVIRPVNTAKLLGIGLVLSGLTITQLTSSSNATATAPLQ